MVRLQFEDLRRTPPIPLPYTNKQQFYSSGKFTGKLRSDQPASLLDYTGGDCLKMIVVPVIQMDRCLVEGKNSLLISERFVHEAGLVCCVQESVDRPWSVLPAWQAEVDDLPEGMDVEADCVNYDSHGNRWPIPLVCTVVELTPYLRKVGDMEDVLEVASRAHAQCASRQGTYCDESHGVCEKFELPGDMTMRRWHVKLDLMSMMFRRWQYEQGHFDQSFVYICSDGSPQWGYDFLITKIFVATIKLPEEDCKDPLAYVDVDEHLLPMATCGHGRSKLEHKFPKLVRQINLEVGTEQLPLFRNSVRSCYSDQAAEKGLWGSPNLTETNSAIVLQDLRVGAPSKDMSSTASFLFPRAWVHPGLLHIYFNALQAACLRLEQWPDIEAALRGLSRFLSKRLLRNQFVHVTHMFEDDGADVFESFSGGCYNWRWEKLEGLVLQLRRILPVLYLRWRNEDLQREADRIGDDAGDEEHRTSRIVLGVINALKTPDLLFWIEIIWVISHVVGKEARWQEGCRCHGDVVAGTSTPFPKRRRRIGDRIREDPCPWKGHRAVENVMGRIAVLKENIRGASSNTLTQLFGRMTEATRTRLLAIPSRMKEAIIEELEYKLKFYCEYPWLVLEILSPFFGGTVLQSKARARDTLAHFDRVKREGGRLSPGFEELLEGPTPFRRQLDMYATTDAHISSCTVLCTELLAYALAPTQERDLEAVHGKISAAQKRALGAQRLPDSINAIVRKPYWTHLLRNDDFRSYAHEHWLSGIYVPLMQSWSTPARTKALSVHMRHAEIYQYDFAGQFRDESVTKQSIADFKKLVRPLTQKGLGDLTNQETQLCLYWRSVLTSDCVYSMSALPIRDHQAGPVSLQEVLCAFAAVPIDSLETWDSQVFFDVVNLRPSNRTEADSCGAKADTADIVIRVCPTQSKGEGVEYPELAADRARVQTINLRAWCQDAHLSKALSSLRRWHVIGSTSTPCIIPAKRGRSLCAISTPARLPEDTPESLTRALRVALEAAGAYESEFPETAFENKQIEMHLVEQLVKAGVLLRMTNAMFGDVEYGLVWERLQFRMAYRIAEPEVVRDSAREVASVEDYSKLEIMGMLLRLGWVSGGGSEPLTAADRPKRFCLPSLYKGKHYWVALFRWQWLFESRGLEDLSHHWPNGYYQCLLNLSQELTKKDC